MNKNRDLKSILGNNIAKYRKRRKFTQEVFAEKIFLSISALSDIETGNSYPKYDTITKIVETLGVEPYELFIDEKLDFKAKNYEDTIELLNNFKNNEIKIAIMRKIAELVDILD